MSESLENSVPTHLLFTPVNMNITSYIQNLRQYIPKNTHSLSIGDLAKGAEGEKRDGRDRPNAEEKEAFEYVLRRVAIKESWDNKSPRVCFVIEGSKYCGFPAY